MTKTTCVRYFNKPFLSWALGFCWFCHRDTGFHMCHKLQMISQIYCKKQKHNKNHLICLHSYRKACCTWLMPFWLPLGLHSTLQSPVPLLRGGLWDSPFTVLLPTVLLTREWTLQWRPWAAKSQHKEKYSLCLVPLPKPRFLVAQQVEKTGDNAEENDGEPTDPTSACAMPKCFSCSSF